MGDEPLSTVHRTSDGGASSSCLRRVRWERFLPRPSLRVLLVEHDDSTRHIVSALLRKCGYHVAAVGDGCKAWEFMAKKRFQFDLVLAEVAIPSLSGIALLSRIMSSEDCKNIPVIMMSSHDSVNVVLKCMLKGAVDFLVKPVRKNELRNLWQHVWRKHSLNQQVNGSKNNAAHISGNAAEGSETGENSGEGKYDQGSGTKPDMGTERVQELTDPHFVEGGNSNSDQDAKLGALNHDFADKSVADAFVIEGILPVQGCHSDDKAEKAECSYKILPSREETSSPRRCIEEVSINPGAYCQNMHVKGLSRGSAESYREKDEQNVGSPPLWELSLRRREFRYRHTLNHSNSSAFSRYGDKKIQPSNPKLGSSALEIGNNECADQCLSFPQSTDNGTDHSDKATSFFLNGELPSPQVNVGEVPMNYHLHTNCYKDTIALPSSDSPRENALVRCSVSGEDSSYRQQVGFMSLQIPVGVTHCQTFCPGYGAILRPVFYCENSLSPHTSNTIDRIGHPHPLASHQSGPSDNHEDNDRLAMKFSHPGVCHQPYYSLNPSDMEQENRAMSCPQEQASRNENCGQDIFNGSRSNGSAETTNGMMRIGNALENVNESSFQNCNKEASECDCSRRAAALIKFRLKRKDRCFQKKVRYHSRKKLAEQRPRVKGQFVKQKNVGSSTATDAGE